MEQDSKTYKYSVKDPNGDWVGFIILIHKGKVIECRGMGHPIGSDWKSLRGYYEKIGAQIELINDDDSTD